MYTICYPCAMYVLTSECVIWADPGFVGPEACTIFAACFKKKNTECGTEVNICLGPYPGPWKGLV
jgi:hypothetical protein